MGAATAMHAVLALGERVAGLLLVIPPTGWAERAAQVDVYEQMASIVDQRGVDALIAASAANPAPDPFISNAQYRDHRAASLRAAQPARLAANLRGAAHADLPPVVDLAGISAPTLVLAWTGDAAHPVSTAELLQATLPNCTTVVASTAEDVETWTDRAIGFLNGL